MKRKKKMKANTHAFNVELATQLGDVNEALILQHFYWWHQNNSNKKDRLREDHPHPWTYNTIDQFCKIFPYMKKSKLSGAITRLVSKELLITGIFNKMKFDKTKWYSLTQKGLFLFEESVSHFEKSEDPNEKPEDPNENAIPNSNTDSNTDSNKNINKKSDDDILLDKLMDIYPGNVGARKPLLKAIKDLTREEKIQSYNNLDRYSKNWTGYYHNLRNYLEGKPFLDRELDKRETKNKNTDITNTKTFKGIYDDID